MPTKRTTKRATKITNKERKEFYKKLKQRKAARIKKDAKYYSVMELSQQQLEAAVEAMSQLKPLVVQQAIAVNRRLRSSDEHTAKDVAEVTEYFDTAITSMYMLLNGFYEEE